ncbi:MAG: hypothetical protein J5848_03860 [Bacteroidales bacterium]|nr:hypothetical protein [Bacteroidales bacterium]
MKRIVLFFFALATCMYTFAQGHDTMAGEHCHGQFYEPRRPIVLTNDTWYTPHILTDKNPSAEELMHECRHLTLELDAAGFFYDVEYQLPMAKGFTVTGFRLTPTLAYGINERAQLRVGMDATMFAGLDSLYRFRPTFSLLYMPAPWMQIVAGTLIGSQHHLIGNAVYDPSRWIYNYREDGLQITTATNIWESDTWLDWNHYLWPWTADQERFTMGTRHQFDILKFSKESYGEHVTFEEKYSQLGLVSIPFHFIACHRGGEVKTIDTNTVTTFNESVALRFDYIFSNTDKSNSNHIRLDFPILFYHLEDKSLDNSGRSFHPTIGYEFAHIDRDEGKGISIKAIAGYWYGEHYFSTMGNPTFWSINNYSALHMATGANQTSGADIRKMLTLNIALEHEFKGLNLGLNVLAYHDIILGKNNFIFAFYMRYRGKFLIF